jgi:phosphatidylglycerophosphate synthase
MAVERALVLLGGNSGKRILGLSVLMRAVLAASGAGVRRFVLVGNGTAGEEALAASIRADKRVAGRGLDIAYARASELVSSGLVPSDGGPFWLIDGESVFDPGLLKDIELRQGAGAANLLIVADGGGEASAKNGGGRGSGKIESGSEEAGGSLALCSAGAVPRVVDALAGRQAEIGSALPSIMRIMSGLPVERRGAGGAFLIKLDSPAAVRNATKAILQTGRKPQDGFIARHFNRHISLFITRLIADTGIRPVSMSLVTLALGLAGGWSVSRGRGYWSFLLGAVLFELSSIIDGCDGELARLTHRSSALGGKVDVIVDAVTYVAFFSGLAVGLYRSRGSVVYLVLLGMLFLAMAVYYPSLISLTRKTRIGSRTYLVAEKIQAAPVSRRDLSFIDRVAARTAFIFRRDFFVTVVLLGIALGGASLVMYIVAGFAVLEAAYIFSLSKKGTVN